MRIMHARTHNQQAAFTLVEMAIVLVIIGLIIGGVLTAQQVTQNAKINSTIQSIKAYQAAVQSYTQNYGALPGDDQQASTRFSGLSSANNGDGKGTISGTEAAAFWEHLRAAGLVKGTGATLPNDPFGGNVTVQSQATFKTGGFADNTNVVCLDKIPGSAAVAIDQQLDDGVANTGTVRGAEKTASDAATAYGHDTNYVLCTPL
jgi:prepilin-type N-terminal cleavage/methylation domain-containing protein